MWSISEGFCFLVLISTSASVIMDSKAKAESRLNEEEPGDLKKAFGSCLAKKIGTFECANRGALSYLQSMNEKDELKFDNVYLERASGQNRDLIDLDYDPTDFGNVLKAGTRLMEQRSLKWDLGNLFPGLAMQVGPMLNGHGVLQFVMNERAAAYTERDLGTGQMLARNLLLPFLLGFKFSLASLIPLLFGALLIISKKAFILAKIAIFLSGYLGYSSLFGSNQDPSLGNHNGYGYGLGPNYHNHNPYQYKELFPTSPEYNPSIYNQHVIRDTVNVYERERDTVGQNLDETRPFSWSRKD